MLTDGTSRQEAKSAEYLKEGWPPRRRPDPAVSRTVSQILSEVEVEGTPAVRRWSARLDGWEPLSFRVPLDEAHKAEADVDEELRAHIEFARHQIEGFARLQRDTMRDLTVEPLPGVTLGHRHIPVANVGSYSPGGRYPLIASAMMTTIVPKVAGVGRVVAVAPPRGPDGMYRPQLCTMALCGADEILCLGGVQAMAALAFAAVAYSDKAIGTNHVLPTMGAGRYTGGLWVGKFLKRVTFQRVTVEGSAVVAPPTAAIADAELMYGHALTARLRLAEDFDTPR
jgi:sulfopropanediol 3-dehydrogenase